MTPQTSSRIRSGLAAVCLVWAGMVLSISFLEAWVKFTAPSLTLAVGLDVGRHVFGALNLVEIGWAMLTLGLVLAVRLRRVRLAMLAAVWAVVAAQSLWLLPALDARAARLIAGETVPGSEHHMLFVALEGTKVLLLLGGGALLLWKRPAVAPPAAPPAATSAIMRNGTGPDTITRSSPR